MECEFLNDISDAWIQEKLNCTNTIKRERTRRIEERIRSKFEAGPQYFTAEARRFGVKAKLYTLQRIRHLAWIGNWAWVPISF